VDLSLGGIIVNAIITPWADLGAEGMKFLIFLILQLLGDFIALIIDLPKERIEIAGLTHFLKQFE